ncbi:hypothetical protein GCM10027200_29480 [Lentzea nigeriaca]
MALFGRGNKTKLIAPHDALPGRSTPQTVPPFHAVLTDRPNPDQVLSRAKYSHLSARSAWAFRGMTG